MFKNMRALREDKDLTQADVAKLLSVAQTTYSDYENGKINIPIPILKQLAAFYGTTIDYLVSEIEIAEPRSRGSNKK